MIVNLLLFIGIYLFIYLFSLLFELGKTIEIYRINGVKERSSINDNDAMWHEMNTRKNTGRGNEKEKKQ